MGERLDPFCLIVGIICLIIALVLTGLAIFKIGILKAFNSGAVIPINQVKAGQVKVKGTVSTLTTTMSTYSHKQCSILKNRPNISRGAGGLVGSMTTDYEYRSRFIVKDSTGEVLIDPADAVLDIQEECYDQKNGLWVYNKWHGNFKSPTVTNQMMETAISAGDEVIVKGEAVPFQETVAGQQNTNVDQLMEQQSLQAFAANGNSMKIMKGSKPMIVSKRGKGMAMLNIGFDIILFGFFAILGYLMALLGFVAGLLW